MSVVQTPQWDKIAKAFGFKTEMLGVFDGVSWCGSGPLLTVKSPIDNTILATIKQGTEQEYSRAVANAHEAYLSWRSVPAPKRGEIVRQLGEALRQHKAELGALVTVEMGKSLKEGLGEVQEMIDICDYACGQSRMLYGLQTHSERADHRMFEQWHPLGVVGVVTAFNFPVAVWAWNVALAFIAGNTSVWKPSSLTPLCAIACQKIFGEVLAANKLPQAISTLVIGSGSTVGDALINDHHIPLVSYTGSVSIGKRVAEAAAKRLGKTILELGGNNAVIVTEKADLDLAVKSIFFGAIGTAGQRCTSTRRVIAAESIFNELLTRLKKAYGQLKIGSPLDEAMHMGPLVAESSERDYFDAIAKVKAQGGTILWGGEKISSLPGNYITPAVARVRPDMAIVHEETFAPLLYLMTYKGDLTEAIAMQNNVPQGLSSSIFTNDLREAELFLSNRGSDCGIANVNAGTSGAEIGLAFGGEKETGGGRESGSDSWKAYMRRQTNTLNWSGKAELAQGIVFDV